MSKIYGTQELGARMHQWHSGMDAVYGVGSMFYAGHGVTREHLDDALAILGRTYRFRKESRMPAADARHLSALIRDLKALKAGNYIDPADLRDNPGGTRGGRDKIYRLRGGALMHADCYNTATKSVAARHRIGGIEGILGAMPRGKKCAACGPRNNPAPRRAAQSGFTVFLLDLDSHDGIAHYDENARTPWEAEASARTWAEDNLRDGWDLIATVRGNDGAPTPGGFTVFLLDLDSHEGVVVYDGKARSAKAAVAAAQKWAERRLRDGYDVVGVLRGEVTPVNEPDGGIACRWVDL